MLYGLATVLTVAVTSLVWAQPAQAAPAQCTVEEWRNPANFKDCAGRAKDQIGETLGCVGAPTPGSPTSGMPGWFTSRPETSLRSGVPGKYSDYGVGGYGLDTYDLGCLGTAKHPDLLMWNTAASSEFSIAASIMAASNGLRERAYNPGSMWGWSDEFIASATDTVYRYVFTTFGVISLAGAGVYLLWRSRQGNMSEAVKLTAWAVFVLILTTGIVRWPVQAAQGTDKAGAAALSFVHNILGPSPQHVPADKCALGTPIQAPDGTVWPGDPDACIDHRSTAVRASDVATEAVLYRAWLRAVLGSSDSPTAEKYGPVLYDATTLRWEEAARIAEGPQHREGLLAEKAARWNTTAELIRTEDPEAYEHLQGIHGMDRAGAGGVALVSAASFSFFDMAASLVILIAFAVLRLGLILLPLLATIGIFFYASASMRRLLHAAIAAGANILVFGSGSGLYLTVTTEVFDSSLPGYGQVIAVGLSGAILFVLLLRPIRHQYHTVTGRSRDQESLPTRVARGGRQIVETVSEQGQPPPSDEPATEGAGRPESTTAPRRTVGKIVMDSVAPTVASAAGRPEIAAVIAGFNKLISGARPESTTAPARGATIDGSAVPTPASASAVPASTGPAARPEIRS
jgi:hypothetical protein